MLHFCHIPENGKQIQLMLDIKEGGWLIQDNNIRLLADGTSKQNTLPLSVTDIVKITASKLLGMYCTHGLFYFFLILSCKKTKPSCIRIASCCHNIMAGHQLRLHTLCENHRHTGGKIPKRKGGEILVVKVNLSANNLQLTGDTFQNCRFTGAIWSDQSHNFSFFDANTDIVDQCFFVVSYGQMVHFKIVIFHL